MRPRMVPSAITVLVSDAVCPGLHRAWRHVRTKLVEEVGQLRHPKLDGLGEVALLPVQVHGLTTAFIKCLNLEQTLGADKTECTDRPLPSSGA